MGHTVKDKQKLLNRVRRIRGQVDAIERSLVAEAGCAEVLQQITSCRGAMNGLLGVVLEDHIRGHLVDAPPVSGKAPRAAQTSARDQLIDVVHSYFK